MAANENTKFQINYKLSDGTLINLYATDVKDLETGLNDLGMVASLIKATAADLGGSNVTATAVQNIQAQFAATPVAQSAPAEARGTKQCKHGVMAFKTGTSARGPWQGYMCAAQKGALDKCDTIWIRQLKPNTEESITSRLIPDDDGCWVWPGAKHGRGYGFVKYLGKLWYVHRLIYQFKNGPIPEGMDLDHTCSNTSCANPDHLELVSHQENIVRYWKRKHPLKTNTTCIRGHEDMMRIKPNGYKECTGCIEFLKVR